MTNETTEREAGDALGGSRLKAVVMFLWDGIGKPGAWLLLMLVVFIAEAGKSFTIAGHFWMFACAVSFFLARIAGALERIAKASET